MNRRTRRKSSNFFFFPQSFRKLSYYGLFKHCWIDCMCYCRFQHYLGYIAAASAPIYTVLESLLPVLRPILLSNHWMLSQINIVETMVSIEKGMNPAAMTIISSSEETSRAWDQIRDTPTRTRPPLFSSQALELSRKSTELENRKSCALPPAPPGLGRSNRGKFRERGREPTILENVEKSC